LVVNSASAGIPAARHRPRSSVQDCGRYSSRPITACRTGEAYARNSPAWQFSVRPAVPEYCLYRHSRSPSRPGDVRVSRPPLRASAW
jgi:hypothetical protein